MHSRACIFSALLHARSVLRSLAGSVHIRISSPQFQEPRGDPTELFHYIQQRPPCCRSLPLRRYVTVAEFILPISARLLLVYLAVSPGFHEDWPTGSRSPRQPGCTATGVHGGWFLSQLIRSAVHSGRRDQGSRGEGSRPLHSSVAISREDACAASVRRHAGRDPALLMGRFLAVCSSP